MMFFIRWMKLYTFIYLHEIIFFCNYVCRHAYLLRIFKGIEREYDFPLRSSNSICINDKLNLDQVLVYA